MKNYISGWGGFGVKVNIRIKMLEYFKNQVAQLESVIFIKIDQRNFRLERWLVKQQHNLFDIFRGDGPFLDQGQGLVLHLKV